MTPKPAYSFKPIDRSRTRDIEPPGMTERRAAPVGESRPSYRRARGVIKRSGAVGSRRAGGCLAIAEHGTKNLLRLVAESGKCDRRAGAGVGDEDIAVLVEVDRKLSPRLCRECVNAESGSRCRAPVDCPVCPSSACDAYRLSVEASSSSISAGSILSTIRWAAPSRSCGWVPATAMQVSPAAVAEATPASVSSNATTRAGSIGLRRPAAQRLQVALRIGLAVRATSSAEITAANASAQSGGGQHRLDLGRGGAGHHRQRHAVGRQSHGRAHVGRDGGAVGDAGSIRRRPAGRPASDRSSRSPIQVEMMASSLSPASWSSVVGFRQRPAELGEQLGKDRVHDRLVVGERAVEVEREPQRWSAHAPLGSPIRRPGALRTAAIPTVPPRSARPAPAPRPRRARRGPRVRPRAGTCARRWPPPSPAAGSIMRWKMCSRLGSQPSIWVEISSCCARGDRAQVAEMCLGREVAAGRRAVAGVDADVGQQRVAGVAEHLQVAALVGVAVVVDPLRANARPVEYQRLRQVVAGGHHPGVGAIDQRAPSAAASDFSGADAVGAKRQQHVHQAVVADRAPARWWTLPANRSRIGTRSSRAARRSARVRRSASSTATSATARTAPGSGACRSHRRRCDRS